MKNTLNSPIFSIGDVDKKIINIKLKLLRLGYGKNLYPIDEWFDYEIKESIQKYQIDNNLPITGEYDTYTHNKIEEMMNLIYL